MGRAWLSDFGLSTVVEQVSDTTVSGISFPGNLRWAAPELLEGCKEGGPASQLSSLQADIYSFGSIMLQVRWTCLSRPDVSLTPRTDPER